MDTVYHPSTSKTFDSFSHNVSFLKAKIALLTFYNIKYSDWKGQLLILFEYLQLISQAFLIHALTIPEIDIDNHFIAKVAFWFSKLINPSYMVSYEQPSPITSAVLYFVFWFTVLKYLLFIYLGCMIYWNFKEFSWLVSIWRIIFMIQGRAICFLTTSFWLRAIMGVSNENFSVHGINNTLLLIISSILIGLEYVFSFVLEIQFCYKLPSKNFLSSKDYQLQVITLFQKFLLQALQIIFTANTLTNSWIFDSLNLIFSIRRNYHFYTILPLYNLRALLFQGDLLGIVTSLNLSCFFRTLLKTTNYSRPPDINFIITICIIISILLAKISRELIKRIIMKLITGQIHGAPELLLHRVNATKQLRRHGQYPSEYSEKYNLTYLYEAAGEANIKTIFGISSSRNDAQIRSANDENQLNNIFVEYLEQLATRFPENPLIKLHISQLCIKNWELYTKAIKIISELGKSKWSANYLTSSILLYEIEKSIMTIHETQDVNLDLSTYIKCQSFVDKLRRQIIDQIDLRIRICDNMIGDTSDIGEIYELSQLIAKSRARIQKNINILNFAIPDYYIEPLLFCAEYSLILDYSLEDYKRYSDLHSKKYFKYEKYFKDVSLGKENLYQDTNVFILLSGQKFDIGRVLFCTKAIENLCGGDKKLYEGSHISRLFPPTLQIFYNELFKQIFETTKNTALNKRMTTFLHHKDNYIIEADFYIRVHPYMTQNLYLDMIIRPIPSSKEYILLKENGDVEGATRKIAYLLGIAPPLQSISSSIINVKNISTDLYTANHVFNIIHKSVQSENSIHEQKEKIEKRTQSLDDDPRIQIDYTKATELYKNYSSGGQKIELTPIKYSSNFVRFVPSGKKINNYLCTISVLPFELSFLKLITLEEVTDQDFQNYDDEIQENIKEIQEKSKEEINEQEIEVKEMRDALHPLIGSENIDCHEFENDIELVHYTTFRKDNKTLNTEENLLSPHCPKSLAYSPLSSPKSKKPTLLHQVISPHSTPYSDFNHKVPEKIHKLETNTVKRRIKLHRYLTSSYSSQNSQGITVHRSFMKALKTKFYPASFKILCLVFYGVVLFTLSIQIILKIVTDDTMNDLVIKKNMLKYSLLRSQRAIRMQIISIGGVLEIEGALTSNHFDGIGADIFEVVNNLENYRPDLVDQNQKIINSLDSIDSELREKLFSKDIRIYGSITESTDLTVKNVTHFQVIDEIISSIRKLVSLGNPATIEGYHALNFIAMNILGDFALKNNQINELFLESVKKQKEYFLEIIFLCIVIIPFLLISMALILTFIIWRQYFKEKQNFLAFIKLDSTGIKYNLNILRKFKRSLNKDEYFDASNLEEFINYLTSLPKQTQLINPHKKLKFQSIKYSKTLKRYYVYTIKVFFYMTILTAIIIWNYNSAQNSTKVIYRRQNQLEFANFISAKAIIEYASFAELYASNNTNLVEGLEPLTVLGNSIVQMKSIQSETADKLLEEGKYIPEIKKLLFNDDDCQIFKYLDLKYCKYLIAKAQPLGLLPLMGSLDIQMNNKLQGYLDVDKSSISKILAVAYKNLPELLATFSLVVTKAQFIAQKIDDNMTKNISDAQFQRSFILVIFSFSLAIGSLLIWFQILNRLKEANNDFKKTLQIFPPKLILENFFLKTFIRKSSKDYIHDF